jgi:hypothetical protein
MYRRQDGGRQIYRNDDSSRHLEKQCTFYPLLFGEGQQMITFVFHPERMNKKVLYLALIVAAAMAPSILFSQPMPPGGGLPPCGEPFGPACPIDGVSTFLIASGLIYGGKKAIDAGRQKK